MGGGGIVGLVTALIAQKTRSKDRQAELEENKQDRQLQLLNNAYERNVFLEKRHSESEVEMSGLRMELMETKKLLMASEFSRKQLEEKNRLLLERLKEK